MIEKKTLSTSQDGHKTTWNNLVPKKVNVFAWRASKNRLPVKELLDKKGIDLDSLLCPVCNNQIESLDHCLTQCDMAIKTWEYIFKWWKCGNYNRYGIRSVRDLFNCDGGNNIPEHKKQIWHAVLWSTSYFLWKNRNNRVFGRKTSGFSATLNLIQTRSFEWISRRAGKTHIGDWINWCGNGEISLQ